MFFYNKIPFSFLAVFCVVCSMYAQNTVGSLFLEQTQAKDGYTLIYPDNQSSVYLINNCGEIINEWTDPNDGRAGTAAYLMSNGDLIRAKRDNSISGHSFGAGGAGGIIEILNWDSELLWRYTLADSIHRQHHQFEVMPNGNILLLAWEKHGLEELVQLGFDTVQNSQNEIWADFIVELDPTTSEVVWEWHTWDHLIQDFDSSKANFGSVAENSARIDINYHDYSFGRPDWMHSNAIDYNPELDQIILSVRNFGEMWIIDHSTTTEEAASDHGGNSDQGGDLLYRWGNNAAFKMGTQSDQKSFNQHDVSWIDENIHQDHPYFGAVLFFNNFIADGISKGQIFSPVWDEENRQYVKENGVFLPQDFTAELQHPLDEKNFSTAASSIQILENGNILMCAARQGRIFELSPTGKLVWEYLVPLKLGTSVPQGFLLDLSDNFTVRAEKYDLDYSAFENKDLSPKGYIESNPNEDQCVITATTKVYHSSSLISVQPNPANQSLFINAERPTDVTIFDALGAKYFDQQLVGKVKVDVANWPTGIYFAQHDTSPILVRISIIH